MSCADCGCTVIRAHRLRACATDECCCTGLPLWTTATLAAEVRRAMESSDLTTMASLLAPDARWGAPEQDVPTCRNAQQVLSWYELARDNGMRAEITDVVVIDERIVVGLHVRSATDISSHTADSVRWQVLSVEDGRIAEIRGYESRDEATAFATHGLSNW